MKVILVDSTIDSRLDGELRTEMVEWARALGVDTKHAMPTFALAHAPDGRILAHFSMKLQRDGRDYVMPNANRVAAAYGGVTVEVAYGSWPSWFGEPVDVPDMSIPVLLETLAVAGEAASNLRSAVWQRLNLATEAAA